MSTGDMTVVKNAIHGYHIRHVLPSPLGALLGMHLTDIYKCGELYCALEIIIGIISESPCQY